MTSGLSRSSRIHEPVPLVTEAQQTGVVEFAPTLYRPIDSGSLASSMTGFARDGTFGPGSHAGQRR